jgi:hypothetical protein
MDGATRAPREENSLSEDSADAAFTRDGYLPKLYIKLSQWPAIHRAHPAVLMK